jgi:hypothetical protein
MAISFAAVELVVLKHDESAHMKISDPPPDRATFLALRFGPQGSFFWYH